MAMDKEMLLQRLQAQYLTRQEVLYKLPLNISITSFWPELIERRKLSSTVLPLHGANSKPLWYVLTDKMIAASEKLCALALEQSTPIDPYKAALTEALMEELFFTSFVEGAQIDLPEAMDYLKRGGEPESVAEQLVHNNRSAWSDMLRGLYYPLDDRMVRTLAYRLTEDMEGHATEYRQTDTHTIAAMGNEAYELPNAAALPSLMQEYYAFMANKEIHPLIKAAAGHAYLLVTRPFPDGNERLARMISYAILLRSGYDFFQHISLSSLIAKESFRYYKAMQDIIRSENSGDLTYFMEYYLDLLARAIDAKKEQEQRRQQEALEAERKAATQPLARHETQGCHSPDCEDSQQSAPPTEDFVEDEPQRTLSTLTESPPGHLFTADEYFAMLHNAKVNHMTHLQRKRIDRICSTLTTLVHNGPHTITRADWEQVTGVTQGVSKDDIPLMEKLGLIRCKPYSNMHAMREYYLPLCDAPQPTEPTKPMTAAIVEGAIRCMLNSEHARERQMATGLLDMLENGKLEFTYNDWIERNPITSKDIGFAVLRAAINHGFITFENGVYRFAQTYTAGPQCYTMPEKQRDVLLRMMEAFPDTKFSIKNASVAIGIKPATVTYYLENFKQRGLLKVSKAPGNVNLYEFSDGIHGIFRATAETDEETVFREVPRITSEAPEPPGYIAPAI